MKAVRIECNSDGSYSAYIFSHCIYTGSYDECVRQLAYNGEYV